MRAGTKRLAWNVGSLSAGLFLVVAIAILAGCASNPTRAWLDTCDGYHEALVNVNDALDVGIITKDSDVAKAMQTADKALYPVCTGAEPPESVDRESLQRDIDRILLEIIKAQKAHTEQQP